MVQQLDGTVNEWGWCKQKLGVNAILAVSFAVCKAGAQVKKIPLHKMVLPVPAFNVINGGSHAGNKLAMQEFMILPTGATSFKEAMKMGSEVYHHLKSVIKKKYGQDATNVGDEGGFAPNIQENKEGLELLKTAIEKAGYTGKVVIGMDVAASEFYKEDKSYDLNFKKENNDGSQRISGEALKDLYKSFVVEYPIVSIEDPFDQDDWEHYAKMTAEIGDKVQIVGDDLLVTNPKRVGKAINEKSCNALLLKVNQIGSVTESIEAVKMSKKAGWGVMASHRSSWNLEGRRLEVKRAYECGFVRGEEGGIGRWGDDGRDKDTFPCHHQVPSLSTCHRAKEAKHCHQKWHLLYSEAYWVVKVELVRNFVQKILFISSKQNGNVL
ncbi:hypothetical protein KSS87_013872 [Heliosperma pusillum]|nr:hypothetical protein KSS87_013872 [Heliosperma pusillum]